MNIFKILQILLELKLPLACFFLVGLKKWANGNFNSNKIFKILKISMTSKIDGSSLIIKQSCNMVSSYFQNTKRAQASCSNTSLNCKHQDKCHLYDTFCNSKAQSLYCHSAKNCITWGRFKTVPWRSAEWSLPHQTAAIMHIQSSWMCTWPAECFKCPLHNDSLRVGGCTTPAWECNKK